MRARWVYGLLYLKLEEKGGGVESPLWERTAVLPLVTVGIEVKVDTTYTPPPLCWECRKPI